MSKISPMQAEALGLRPATPIAVANPVAKPVAKPLAEPAAKPVTKSIAKPVAKPTAKPAIKAVAKPATKAKPIVKKANVKKSAKKDTKKAKPEKVKMERDSFTMPKDEYAQLTLLKARLTAMGQPAKKSELLRAGIKLLAAMSDNTLKTTLAKVPVIKTGRPNK
jgi:hypothetical protein